MVGLERRYRAAEEATNKSPCEKTSGKEKAKERFPLVEEDDDSEPPPNSVFWLVDDTEEEEQVGSTHVEEEEEYIPRRQPPPTRVPPNSPVGSPPSSSTLQSRAASKSIHQEVEQPTTPQSQKSAAELEVQDALLAIRLRGFLKAQGVSESELDVVFDEAAEEENDEDDETMAAEIDRALAEMHAATAAAAAVENASKGTLVVVESDATPMQEGMHALPPPPRPRATEKRPVRSSPSPPLRNVNVNLSGGRTSPSPPPSVSYMIALLTMRHRYASRRSGNGAGPKVHSSMGYPMWKRSSKLKSVAWVATPLNEDEESENGMGTIQEQEEEDGEIDVDSVVALYAGMC